MATSAKTQAKLKIGLVVDDTLDKPDGVQQYVLSVGEWLRAQGHDVHYLAGESRRQDIANVHSLSRNIKVRFNRNRLSIPLPTSRRKLRHFLDSQQFDILHVQVPYSPWLAHRLIMAASPSTVIFGTFHILPYSPVVRYGAKALGVWTRRSAKRFDKLVSVSPAAAEFALSAFKMPSEVLPNTFDYHKFHTAKPFSKYADNRLNILFLGRLVARKGCLTLLQAIAELLRTEPDLPEFRVLICGKGLLGAQLRQFVSDNALDKYVEFVGFVSEEDKPRYYASADLAVFPSSGGESFGIVLIEAMASGKAAVLAGDNPGYRSVLGAKPDLLFDPKSPKALARLLAAQLHDKKLRQAAAKWGAEDSQRYDTARVGTALVKLYEQALRKRRSR